MEKSTQLSFVRHASFPAHNNLAGGSSGDIPVSLSQIMQGLLCLLMWAGLCLCASWISNAQAQSTIADHANNAAEKNPAQPYEEMLRHDIANLMNKNNEFTSTSSNNGNDAVRIEVELGQLNPRLKLASCEKIQTHVPEGFRLWGRTHIGLRCVKGAVPWNVYWPVNVKIWAPAVVATNPLKPGVTVSQNDIRIAEVNLAESASPAVANPQEIIGRSVKHPINAGQSLRVDDIRMRRWFTSGDLVRITVQGGGFTVSTEGIAIAHGDEGQCSRIRLESKNVICAKPVAEKMAEITL